MSADDASSASVHIREFRGDLDARQVAEVLRESPEAARWSAGELRELDLLAGVTAFISERGGVLSGVVFGRVVLDEAEILNLAVAPASRRDGEGRRLVRRLLEDFRAKGVSRVFLEVRESNKAAIAFYGRLGFWAVGERKDYYQHPREGALVMEAWLKQSTE
jgi:ribosomal-protein-alanine N-acetyltransferase